jgi:hypothetical protein
MELLNMKEESRERIHKMKVDKLGMKLNEDENKAREKYGVQEKPEKKISEKIKKQEAIEKLEESEKKDSEAEVKVKSKKEPEAQKQEETKDSEE